MWRLSNPDQRRELLAESQLRDDVVAPLREIAADPEAFDTLARDSFGADLTPDAIESLRRRLLSGDPTLIPALRLVDADTLHGASGAYDAAGDTILLDASLVGTKDGARTLLEELGHAFDRELNGSRDAAGDEGEIFRRLASGEALDTRTLNALRAENDHGTIDLDGRSVAVEFRHDAGGGGGGGYTGPDYPWNPGGAAHSPPPRPAPRPAPAPTPNTSGAPTPPVRLPPVQAGNSATPYTPSPVSGAAPPRSPTPSWQQYPYGGVDSWSVFGPGGHLMGETEAPTGEETYQRTVEAARRNSANGGPAAAAAIEEAAEGHAHSPETVDRLIDDLQPEIAAAGEGLATREYGREEARSTVDSLGRVAELASEDGAHEIAVAILDGNGLDETSETETESRDRYVHGSRATDLWYLDDAVGNSEGGRGITLGLALADELSARGRGDTAAELRSDVVDSLETLTDATRDAGEARETLDEELGASLANLRGLDEQDIADYISLYQRDHAEVYAAEADHAARLDELLTRHGAALDQLVVADPRYADEVIDAYSALADTSLPARALEWAVEAKSDDVLAAFEGPADRWGNPDTGALDRVFDDIAIRAIDGGTLLQYQAEADGDADSALDRFEALFDEAKLARSLLSRTTTIRDVGFTDLIENARETAGALRALARPGGLAQYNEELRYRATWGRPYGLVDGAFAATSFAFAVRNYGDAEGFVDEATANLALVNGGTDILVRSIDTLNDTGRLGFLSDDAARSAARFSNFGARAVPYVNIVLNSVATAQSIGDFVGDRNAARLLSVVGDGLSLIGAVAGGFVVTKPFAAVLEFGGVALSEIGTYWAEAGERDEIDDEEEAILVRVFEDRFPELREELGEDGFAEAIRQMADASDPTAAEVARRAGLDSEQLLRLFGTVADSNNGPANAVLDYAEVHGVEGEDFIAFTQSFAESAGGIPSESHSFFQAVTHLDLTPEQTLELAAQLGEGGVQDVARRYDEVQITASGAGEPVLDFHVAVAVDVAGGDLDALGIDIDSYRSTATG